MRIVVEGQTSDAVTASSKNSKLTEIKNDANFKVTVQSERTTNEKTSVTGEEQDVPKEKLKQAIKTVNDFLEINQNASKFVLHDGLDRYFVQVVNTQTDEVVKEIPPKKLLDAFYEMQKLLGMIVDEKI